MCIEQKLQKTRDGTKTFTLSKTSRIDDSLNLLIEQIIESLILSYANNDKDKVIDYKSTIYLLYEKLIQLKKYNLKSIDKVQQFKLSEASNDLGMAFYKDFLKNKKDKSLKRAEDFFRFYL
ncbi:MAG: hypothetical protein COB02_09435 [Candidatus Cloacimonadota bacterium]|nr:MAG: hypothetical protein COB02_09435 [Candidatus Cloacimonadota bacterium]